MSTTIGQDVELTPLRTLEDFLTDAARFQVPPVKDLERWSNRILNNLIYYQTNYFAVILAIFLLVGVIHPKEMLLGFVSMLLAFGVFAYATSRHPDAISFKKGHPVVSLLVIVAAGYFLVAVLGSVIVFLFGIALPLLLVFVHASIRLRSLRNKIQNKLEAVGLKKSPMGHILTVLGIEVELIQFNKID